MTLVPAVVPAVAEHFLTWACASIRTTAGPLCPQNSGSNSVFFVVATRIMASVTGFNTIGSLGDHGVPRHRFTGKKNNRIWRVVWMVRRFYHSILHSTVLSSTTTVDQMELGGALTRYLARDCEVGLAEVRRGMKVPPLEYLSKPVCFRCEDTGVGFPPRTSYPQNFFFLKLTWSAPATHKEVHKTQACQSTNLDRRPC